MTPRQKISLAGIVLTAVAGLALVGYLASVMAPAPARQAVMYKSATCGCCTSWADYMQDHGYAVTVVEREDMGAVKDQLGVPDGLRSCHTAQIDGYVIEGHVPAEAVDRLLSERPAVRGLASPGMPSGAPGMDGGPKDPNPIYSFDGSQKQLFATY